MMLVVSIMTVVSSREEQRPTATERNDIKYRLQLGGRSPWIRFFRNTTNASRVEKGQYGRCDLKKLACPRAVNHEQKFARQTYKGFRLQISLYFYYTTYS